jgi:hypothetical protein
MAAAPKFSGQLACMTRFLHDVEDFGTTQALELEQTSRDSDHSSSIEGEGAEGTIWSVADRWYVLCRIRDAFTGKAL